MKTHVRFATYIGLPLLAALAPAAQGGCGDISQIQPPFIFASTQTGAKAQALVQRAGAASAAAAQGRATFNTASIVGLWKLQFLSEGNTAHNPPIPNDAVVDFGYAQWHSDGTEIMNSGAHAPATQNFCMGTWVQTGFFTYELNHFALSYDATSGQLAANVNIFEQITLDPSGNEFTGSFTINVYDPNSGQQVDHITGTVSASRITVDDTTP